MLCGPISFQISLTSLIPCKAVLPLLRMLKTFPSARDPLKYEVRKSEPRVKNSLLRNSASYCPFIKSPFFFFFVSLATSFFSFFFNSFIKSTLRRAHLYHYVCISHTTTKSSSTSAIQILKEENDSWVAVLSVQDFFQYLSSISSLI